MSKVGIVIQREYLSRVRKKSFLVMTILGPLLMGGVFGFMLYLNKADSDVKTIAVVDQTHAFGNLFKSNERLQFVYSDQSVDSLRNSASERGYFGVLVIPQTATLDALEKGCVLYSESKPGLEVLEKISGVLEKEINDHKYKEAGIDPKKLASIKTDVSINTRDMEDKETNTPIASVLGFVGGLLIYLFIFVYGTMVMRGVLEEKTSRIVEVIISSVRPFELMMGKIIGVALVGLTQFLLWIVLSFFIYTGITQAVIGDTDPSVGTIIQPDQPGAVPVRQLESSAIAEITQAISSINFPLMVAMFVFYFLGGYLLYSALFAAIGSAVDTETDVQQFMLPVTIPLILSYIAAVNVMNNPQGDIAFWFSMIPFTSPIVMMVRVPFGVPWEQVAASMLLLVGGFIFTTWMAAKIYRTGILLYGKKVTYKELLKWVRYKA
ncbi:MAG: ABC transporter permease [Bacteroidota bacterium]